MTGPVQIRPKSPGREAYGADPGAELGRFERKAVEAFDRGGRRASLPAAAYDPILGDLAAAHARITLLHDSAVAIASTEALLAWAGAVDPHPQFNLLQAQGGGDDDLLEHLEALGAQQEPMLGQPIIGIGVAREGRHRALTVVHSDRLFEVERLPKRWQAGAPITIAGRLAPGFEEPSVLWLEPGGRVERAKVIEAPGGVLRASFEPRASGEVLVEVLAVGPRGPTVAALFPLHVGIDPPREWTATAPPDESAIADASAAEAAMLTLINAERTKRGFSPVAPHPGAAAAARRYAEESAERDILAHVGPDGSSPSDRLRAAGVPTSRVAENLALNPSLFDAHAGLMRSLGHRQNILDGEATHVGIGVSIRPRDHGQRQLLIVEEFIRPLRHVIPGVDLPALRLGLELRRGDRNLPPLEADPFLDQHAAHLARRVLETGQVDVEPHTDAFAAAMADRSGRWARWAIQAFLVPDPIEDTVDSAGPMRPEVTHLGLGIAAPAPGAKDPRSAVVQILATARPRR